MAHSLKKQYGIGTTAVMIVVVLLIAGVIGLLIYSKQNRTGASGAVKAGPPAAAKSDSPNQVVSREFYLRDWNVQAEYSSDLTLITHSVTAQKAIVSSTELDAEKDAQDCFNPKTTFFVIERYATPDGARNLTKVGDYYYGFTATHAPCPADVYTKNAIFSKTEAVYKAITAHLEAMPPQTPIQQGAAQSSSSVEPPYQDE